MRSVVYITNNSAGFSLLANAVKDRWTLIQAVTVQDACAAVASGAHDAVFFDPVLHCANGKHLLLRLARTASHVPLFIVSGEYWLLFSRFAAGLGICGFYVLPGDINRLIAEVEQSCTAGSGAEYPDESPELFGTAANTFLGVGSAARELRNAIYRLRNYVDPVVILGESGSGKELVARMIHENSPVYSGPFVPVNASCICDTLAESELFGTVRGAFTGAESRPGYFESADGGTLFLDEVAELHPGLQAKLLRIVEDGMITRVGSTKGTPCTVRLICATNRNLRDLVDRGLFREDLYYRLDAFRIRIPPLRKRREDIGVLAEFQLRKKNMELSASALSRLRAYHWPGNVRQLFRCLDRAAGAASRGIIYPDHLDF